MRKQFPIFDVPFQGRDVKFPSRGLYKKVQNKSFRESQGEPFDHLNQGNFFFCIGAFTHVVSFEYNHSYASNLFLQINKRN